MGGYLYSPRNFKYQEVALVARIRLMFFKRHGKEMATGLVTGRSRIKEVAFEGKGDCPHGFQNQASHGAGVYIGLEVGIKERIKC